MSLSHVDDDARARFATPATVSAPGLLFTTGVLVVAAHVVVDAFLAPEPGTRAADHLGSGLTPLAVLAALVALYPHVRDGVRATAALTIGTLAFVGAGIAAAHTRAAGASGDDWTGLVLLPTALALWGVGAWLLWRSRKRGGHVLLRRALLAVGGGVVAFSVVLPIAIAIVATHRPREAMETVDLGRPHQVVRVRTEDGLVLQGRYVRSRNGAAVIVFPGSSSRAPQARVLARRGYGVLMLDMRGYGASEGDPNAFGWGATRDVEAGVAFLQRRPDVEPGRIGGLGFSVGGEQLLETAAHVRALRAVVSEGAGERSVRETLLRGMAGWPSAPMAAVQTAAVALLSGHLPPPALQDLVGRIAPRPIMLIHAGHGRGGEDLQPSYYEAAGAPKALWYVREATHTGAFTARPRAYARRLIAFFDRALLVAGRGA